MGEDPGTLPRVPRAPRGRMVVALGLCVAVAAAVGWWVLHPSDHGAGGVDSSGPPERGPELVLQAGDPLANGFVVADGTTVPGGMYPELGDRGAMTFVRSSAQIQVPGDMTTAVRDFLDQALDLGYVLVAGNADDACWSTPLEGEAGEPAPERTAYARLHCSVGGNRATASGQEQFRLEAQRTFPVAGLSPRNDLRIEFSADNVTGTRPTDPARAVGLPEPGTGPPRPEVPLQFPGSSDPLCGATLELVAGSRILAVAGDCGFSSRITLVVTGDPEEVYEAYAEQVRRSDPDHSSVESNDFRLFDVAGNLLQPERPVHTVTASWDDSSSLEVRMQEGDGVHAPTLWISEVRG